MLSGGSANITEINGGTQNVSGFATNTTINSDGKQNIASGGVGNGTIINAGGQQTVSSGGLAEDTTINSGGKQEVLSGGSANITEINGGMQNVSGFATSTTINSGGIQNIHSGGSAANTTISNGVQNVSDGSFVSNTSVLDEGIQNILPGGSASGTTLSGGTINLSSGGKLTDVSADGGMLNIYGDNSIGGNTVLNNNAVVNISPSANMTTLGMQHLSADNATFNMNVDLVAQTADKLQISDSYEGNALLKLTNVAAPAAKETTDEGIKLVEFGSSASVNGSFGLVGGQWDEGGHIYKLAQGNSGDQDYYLRSMRQLTDTFKTMLNIPVMNVMMAQTGMNSLQKRLGDLHGMSSADKHQGVWVRIYYKDMQVKDLLKTDMKMFGAEAGYDWLFRAEEPTKLYAGVLVGFVQADNIKTETERNNYSKGDGSSPSVGVYATLVNDDRWFVDIAARNFWSKLDMTNYSASGTELAYKPERNIFAASVEVGKSFEKESARDRFVRIEPKAEVMYMNASGKSAGVTSGVGELKYDAANYLNAKAGVLLAYKAKRNNGLLIEPLLELAYRYEFMGDNTVSYGGARETSQLKGGTVEANAGLNMQLTDNLYWYALGSYEAGEKLKGWGVYAGIRYAFGGVSKPDHHAKQKPQVSIKKKQDTKPKAIKAAVPNTEKSKEYQNKPMKKDYSFMEEMERRWREGK